jgi:hypothetical protein
MSANLSTELQEEIDAAVMAFLKRGLAVRRRNIAWSGFFLVVSLLILSVLNLSDATFISAMLAVSALCIIWALMSMSASINAQFDGLAILIASYVHQKKAQQGTAADAAERRS